MVSISLHSLIMVDLPAIGTTTLIKILQFYKCQCLACAHEHTLAKPFRKRDHVQDNTPRSRKIRPSFQAAYFMVTK